MKDLLQHTGPPQLVGFDIEMARRFAQQLEVAVEFLPSETDELAADRLKSGACDVLFTSRAINAKRVDVEKFAMSQPVYQASAGLSVKNHRRDA